MNRYVQGVEAEKRMSIELLESLRLYGIYDAEIVEDVCYNTPSGSYAQVDAVLVCSKGLFCIEYKSWTGHVTTSTGPRWPVERGNTPRKPVMFNNPVQQNANHKYVLDILTKRNVKNLGNRQFKSVIVFDRKTKLINSTYENVMNIGSLPSYIMRYGEEISPELQEAVVDFLRRMVEINKPHFDRQHKSHVKAVKK